MNNTGNKLIFYCLVPSMIFLIFGMCSVHETIKTENKYCPRIKETCKIELKEITKELPLILNIQNKEYGKIKYKTGEYFNYTRIMCQVSTNKTMKVFDFPYIPGYKNCSINGEYYKMANSPDFTDCFYNDEELSLKCNISTVWNFTTLTEKRFLLGVLFIYVSFFYFLFSSVIIFETQF